MRAVLCSCLLGALRGKGSIAGSRELARLASRLRCCLVVVVVVVASPLCCHVQVNAEGKTAQAVALSPTTAAVFDKVKK